MEGRIVLGGGKGSSQWGVSASGGFSSGSRALDYHQLASKVQWPIWEVNVEKIKVMCGGEVRIWQCVI